MVVLVLYAVTTLVPPLPPRLALTAHFLHALSWRLFHSYGLGLLLRAQSKSKWLVRHYLKHYHYPGSGNAEQEPGHAEIGGGLGEERESVVKRATEEAFGNWQVGYNISLVMTYGELDLSYRLSDRRINSPNSIFCWSGMEDISPAVGLDCQRDYTPTRPWSCTSSIRKTTG